MSCPHTGLLVLVAVAHLGAASLPCPSGGVTESDAYRPLPRAFSHPVDAHPHPGAHGFSTSHPDPSAHAAGGTAEMAARCTCGCGETPAGGGVAGRLGQVLLRAADAASLPIFERGVSRASPRLPEAPAPDRDPVPI